MKPVTLFGVLIGLGAATACTEPAPTATLPVYEEPALGIAANGTNATAPLSGSQDVPAVDTRARGNAVFHVSRDGSELSYKLIVANISNVVQAHIHLAPAGTNGSVVAFLFGFEPPGGRVNGVLAEGTITEADLIGPLAGQSIADLVAEMSAGDTYVNVHTIDFPPGEVRGQIR